MPITYYQRKEVQITVYAVKPRRRIKLVKSTHEQHSGDRRHHQPPIAGAAYDRKAQLLLYSHQLRAKARLEKSSSYKPQSQHKVKEVLQIASVHKVNKFSPRKLEEDHDLQISSGQNHDKKVNDVRKINSAVPWKVVPVGNKPSQYSKLPKPPPSCFGDWTNILLPTFCMRDRTDQGKKKKKKNKNKKITVSLGDKMNAIMMSSRMEKERIGVMAKFLSVMRRH